MLIRIRPRVIVLPSLLPRTFKLQLVYKDTLKSPVAALLSADYRGGGMSELLAVGEDGEVRGYVPMPISEARERVLGDKSLQQVRVQPEHGKTRRAGVPITHAYARVNRR